MFLVFVSTNGSVKCSGFLPETTVSMPFTACPASSVITPTVSHQSSGVSSLTHGSPSKSSAWSTTKCFSDTRRRAAQFPGAFFTTA
eukprot:Skav232283  [mRNA]  locus=scaffold882:286802:287059:+ [translate_table: standard]